jgi:hypothetical protein
VGALPASKKGCGGLANDAGAGGGAQVRAAFTTFGVVPRRFRAWAGIGNGDLLLGDWIPRADLPIWEPCIGEAELRIIFGEHT